jgi:hypothetical protein
LEEETQAEYDYVLKEYAGEVIPSLAACLPGNMFDSFFQKISIDLFRLMHKTESSPSEQSFVIGVIGEAICNLDVLMSATAERLFSGNFNIIIFKKSLSFDSLIAYC